MRNDYEIRGDVTAIWLVRQNGERVETLIDTPDLELVRAVGGLTWRVHEQPSGQFYAVARTHRGGRHRSFRMHRVIMSPPKNKHVDHINHNGLDNRRSNLRIVRPGANNENRKGPNSGNRSGMVGVSQNKGRQSWRVICMAPGSNVRIYDAHFESLSKATMASKIMRALHKPHSYEARKYGPLLDALFSEGEAS